MFCMIMQKLLYVYSKTSVFRVSIFRVKSLHFNICGNKNKICGICGKTLR